MSFIYYWFYDDSNEYKSLKDIVVVKMDDIDWSNVIQMLFFGGILFWIGRYALEGQLVAIWITFIYTHIEFI